MFNKTILSVHAHPDDTEIFCSGTLKLLKNAGYHIVIATMTGGGLGGIRTDEEKTITVRRKEAEASAAVIGAEYYCLMQRDGYVFDHPDIRIQLASLIRKVKAGIIFTHLPFDYHCDHRATALITEAAAMTATLPNVPCQEPPLDITPLLYHTITLSSTDTLGGKIPAPHFMIDISTTIETKLEMLSHHHSQIELMRVMHRINDFFGEMKKQSAELGSLCGVSYAEAFWQHLGGGFQKTPDIQTTLKEQLITDFNREVFT